MPYQIDRYNGTLLTEVPDQTVDTSICDLKLVGKNYAGYGEIQNENIVHLLENFRGESAPRKPLVGQIWYDELTNKIKLRDVYEAWRTLSITDVSSTAPTGLAVRDKGNLWFNDTSKQINIWDGSNYVLIGPEIATGFDTTRLTSTTIRDNGATEHAIIKIFSDGVVVGVISNEEFEIGIEESITGFTVIKKGITLVNTPSTGISGDSFRFWGTASNAIQLDGRALSEFVLRSPSGSTFDDSGFTVGVDGDLKFSVLETDKPTIENPLGGTIRVRIKSGSINNDVGIFSESGITPGINESYNLGSSTRKWKEVHSDKFLGNVTGTLSGNVLGTDLTVLVDGDTKTFTGTSVGSHRGDVRASSGTLMFNGATNAITATTATITNINANTLTLVDTLVGRVKGSIYADDDTIAYDSNGKQFTGTLIGRATSTNQLDNGARINGTLFDGTTDITVTDDSKLPVTGGTMLGYVTLHADPILGNQAATKQYVDDTVKSKTLFFSLDTRGLVTTGTGSGSIATLLNQLAPTNNFLPGTRANIASTIQNVSTSTSVGTASFISIHYVNSVSVTTTIQNPTRNNLLIYQINAGGTSWEYVSG